MVTETGGGRAVPVRGMTRRRPASLSWMTSLPLYVAARLGANPTSTRQVVPTESSASGQSRLVTVKPESAEIALINVGNSRTVIVRVTSLVVVERTGCCGNWRDVTESVAVVCGTTRAHVSPTTVSGKVSLLPPNTTSLASAPS